ncbi:MAG: hypothetical protein NVS4B8_11150 [Herpetosiphon sp.]
MERESATLAEAFIAEICAQEGITPDQLTLHADRGSSMTSKTVAPLLMDLGVTKTDSRPHVSNDNPFSEALGKTLKNRPDYPKDFGSVADARAWTRRFIKWYNQHHQQSALGLRTSAMVHHGETDAVRTQQQQVLDAAHAAHPEPLYRAHHVSWTDHARSGSICPYRIPRYQQRWNWRSRMLLQLLNRKLP